MSARRKTHNLIYHFRKTAYSDGTHLETHQHGGHDDNVHVAVMVVHVMDVVHRQADEQKPTEYVAPNINLYRK